MASAPIAAPSGRTTARNQRRWSGDWVVVSVVIAVWAATLLPLLPSAATNVRLVEAFDTDAAMQLNLVLTALRTHSWAIPFGPYGHLYFNIGLAGLKPIWPVTQQTVVITMRSLSLASGAALLLFTFAWTRRTHGSLAAWIALGLVALNPMVYRWSMVVHPDMLQTVLLLGALAATARAFDHPTTVRIAIASALAGLAFATKYSGVFVLPFIAAAVVGRAAVLAGPHANARVLLMRLFVAAVGLAVTVAGFAIDGDWVLRHIAADGRIDVPLPMSLESLIWIVRGSGVALLLVGCAPWLWARLKRNAITETIAWGWALALVTFVACFVVFSPYSLVKLAFIKGLYYEIVETGAVLNVQWTKVWLRGFVEAIPPSALVALVATLPVRYIDRRHLTSGDIVLSVWIALYMVVLLAPVHELAVHYALPLIAPAAILVGRGIASSLDLLGFRAPRVPRWIATAAVIVAVAGLSVPQLPRLVSVREETQARTSSASIRVGNWLLDRIPANAFIVYDYYTYVPPVFFKAVGTWGNTPEWLRRVKPDVIVINPNTTNIWRDSHPESEEPYAVCLHDGTCGYVRTHEDDGIEVFQRAEAAGRLPGKSQQSSQLFGGSLRQ